MNATLLSVKELAVKLGVSEKSIQRAYRKGEIPVERLCNLLRFDLEKVRRVMQERGAVPIIRRRTRATGGESRRRATTSPRSVRRGRS